MSMRALSGAIVTVFLVSLFAIGLPAPARGDTPPQTMLFSENFNSYAVGSFPDDKFGVEFPSWSVWEEDLGNNYLRATSARSGDALLWTLDSFPSSVAMEFKSRHEYGFVDFYATNYYHTSTWTPSAGDFVFMINAEDGSVYASYYYWSDTSNYVYDHIFLGSFASQPWTWYKVKVVLIHGLADYYLDDQFIASYDFGAVIPVPIENFHLWWTTWGWRDIDDVSIWEPYVYALGGIQQPINADGSSIFKIGSTIPVKFPLSDASGTPVSTAVATLSLAKISNGIEGTYMEAVSRCAADSGNQFRYDSTAQQYIFNLATKELEKGTYGMRIALDDGQTFAVIISFK